MNRTCKCLQLRVFLSARHLFKALPRRVCETPDTQSVKLWLQVNFWSVLILAAVWHRAWPTFWVPVDQERKSTSRRLFIAGLQRGSASLHLTPLQISLSPTSKLTPVTRLKHKAPNQIRSLISVKFNVKRDFVSELESLDMILHWNPHPGGLFSAHSLPEFISKPSP